MLFRSKVNADPALTQKFKDAQAAYKGDTSDKTAVLAAIAIPIAKAIGFNLTVEDFKAVYDNDEEGESSADELKAVAGGWYDECGEPLEARDYCALPNEQVIICGALSPALNPLVG